ncbi:MAG: restriction endonuclease subunit S [Acidimicrobiaceae bacterium]|nr:restriction endonuclease subunit S [Acidimicrobiaceae bacterium]
MTLRISPEEIASRSASPLLAVAHWWERCRLGDVAEVANGAAFKSKEFNTNGDGLPLIRIRDVGQPEASTHYSGEYKTDYLVQSGDLLIGMDGDFRIARWNGVQSLLNQRVCRLRVGSSRFYSDRFLEHVLQPYLDEIHKATSAVTVKHLSSRTVQDLPIPLPPRAEQERIVSAIEEHFSRLDFAETALEATRSKLQTLRRSVLAAAFYGRLTNPSHTTNADCEQLPGDWRLASIADVAEVHLGRQRSPQHHTGEQMRPYLRAANVTWDGINLEDVKTMNFHDADFDRFRLTRGDILLNEASGSPNEVGKPAVWGGEIEDCCFQNTLLRLRPRDLNGDYLYWYCYSSALSGRFGEAGRGVNIRHLGKRGLSQFPIPLGPRAEQERVVDAIEESLSRLDAAEATFDAVRSKMGAFRRSVLAEAFAGRLVPQNSDDEPAAALLARIAAERPVRPTSRKRSK